MRFIFFLLITIFTFATAKAQNPIIKKSADTTKDQIDTLKQPVYVNKGKIAAHRAVTRSLIFPGLGQIYNYGLVVDDVQSGAVKGKKVGQKLYIISKIGAIYIGGTLLVMSYADNRTQYKRFLAELQNRQENGGAIDPNSSLAQYTNTDALTIAKNIYKRNSQVVLISMVGLYGLNVLDAYITARLKYFNVDDTLVFKISPSVINSNTMYGYNIGSPALKITFKL